MNLLECWRGTLRNETWLRSDALECLLSELTGVYGETRQQGDPVIVTKLLNEPVPCQIR